MICLIITTSDSKEKAQLIAKALISKKLAACVQIDTVESFYSWKEEIRQDKEYRLMIKTLKSKYKSIENEIAQLNNYDVSQVTCLDIDQSLEVYSKWIQDYVK